MTKLAECLAHLSELTILTEPLVKFHLEHLDSATAHGLSLSIETLLAAASSGAPLSDDQVNILESQLAGFSSYWKSQEDLGAIDGLAFNSAKLTGTLWWERMEELGHPIPTNKLLNVNKLIKSSEIGVKSSKGSSDQETPRG